jgi:hypothetical protein
MGRRWRQRLLCVCVCVYKRGIELDTPVACSSLMTWPAPRVLAASSNASKQAHNQASGLSTRRTRCRPVYASLATLQPAIAAWFPQGIEPGGSRGVPSVRLPTATSDTSVRLSRWGLSIWDRRTAVGLQVWGQAERSKNALLTDLPPQGVIEAALVVLDQQVCDVPRGDPLLGLVPDLRGSTSVHVADPPASNRPQAAAHSRLPMRAAAAMRWRLARIAHGTRGVDYPGRLSIGGSAGFLNTGWLRRGGLPSLAHSSAM